MKFRFVFSFVFLFILSACATPTTYRPASITGKGYRDQKLDSNKFRVSFKGNRITTRETVENYLIYRAAEVTLKEGFEFFSMTNLTTDRKTEYEATTPVTYGFYLQNQRRFPYYLYGSPAVGPGGTMENTEYEAVAYITMANNIKESMRGSFYKATEVISNLEDKIERPERDDIK